MKLQTSASVRNLILAAAIGLSLSFAVVESPASFLSVTDAQVFGRTLPLAFEENRGQADAGVRFLAHTPTGEDAFQRGPGSAAVPGFQAHRVEDPRRRRLCSS